MSPAKRSMEKQLTGVRVQLTVDEQSSSADCNLFLESYGPPPKWRGRLWAIAPPRPLKKGAKATLTLPKGATGEITILRAGARGAYDFQGEGLPPDF
jgi:hypothetical protein